MIEHQHPLSLISQRDLLGLHRSGLYYRPVAVTNEDLVLMGLLDKQYLKPPFYGYRKMTKFLQGQGYQVNHKRVRRLMRLMGIEAIYCRPNTSEPNQAHKIYPYAYLLRKLIRFGHRHHVCAEGKRFYVSDGYQGPIQPLRAGMVRV